MNSPLPSPGAAWITQGKLTGEALAIHAAWVSGRLVDREAMREETNVARLKGPMRLRRRFVTEWELVDE